MLQRAIFNTLISLMFMQVQPAGATREAGKGGTIPLPATTSFGVSPEALGFSSSGGERARAALPKTVIFVGGCGSTSQQVGRWGSGFQASHPRDRVVAIPGPARCDYDGARNDPRVARSLKWAVEQASKAGGEVEIIAHSSGTAAVDRLAAQISNPHLTIYNLDGYSPRIRSPHHRVVCVTGKSVTARSRNYNSMVNRGGCNSSQVVQFPAKVRSPWAMHMALVNSNYADNPGNFRTNLAWYDPPAAASTRMAQPVAPAPIPGQRTEPAPAPADINPAG